MLCTVCDHRGADVSPRGSEIGHRRPVGSRRPMLARLSGGRIVPLRSALALTGKKATFRRWKPKSPRVARSTPRRRGTQGFAGADIRSIDSANGLSALCGACMTRRRQKDRPPGVEARRPHGVVRFQHWPKINCGSYSEHTCAHSRPHDPRKLLVIEGAGITENPELL
jgi:hypothetical protein